MGYALGVDLGTAFTAAAVLEDEAVSMLGLGNRALQIPSVLYLQENGQFLVGEAAERHARADPLRVAREFKRRLGSPDEPLIVGGVEVSAEKLSAELLRHVVAVATERRREPPARTVLTHPANWGGYMMGVFRKVVDLAEVPTVAYCPEPQAAAVQYASRSVVEVGERVAVYDLGAGTFDVCVLEKTPGGFELLGIPDGDDQLGGMDFDHALFTAVQNRAGLPELDRHDAAVRTGLERLRRDCVEAKEVLSTEDETVISISWPGVSVDVVLSRTELEALIRERLAQTLEPTRRTIASAGLTPSQLTGIVLIGGSSRIPLVSQLLHEELGVPTARDTHPKHDVVLGALRQLLPQAAARPAPPSPAKAMEPSPSDQTVPSTRPPQQPPTTPPVRSPAVPNRRTPVPSAQPTTLARSPGPVPSWVLPVMIAMVLGAVSLPLIGPHVGDINASTLNVKADPAEHQIQVLPLSGELTIDVQPDIARTLTVDVGLFGGAVRRADHVQVEKGEGNGTLTLPWLATWLRGPVTLTLKDSGPSLTATAAPVKPWYKNPAGVAPIGLALFSLAYAESMLRAVRQRRRVRTVDLLGLATIGALMGVAVALGWWGIGSRLLSIPLVLPILILMAMAGMGLGLVAPHRRTAPSVTPRSFR